VSGMKGARWGQVKPCPSWPAYKHHIRLREPVCEPCRQFVNDARAASRARAAYRASVAAWRADYETSLWRKLVALLAEAYQDEREAS
jgi:hypothetical protein